MPAALWKVIVQLEEALLLFANLTLKRDHIRVISKARFISMSHKLHPIMFTQQEPRW